MGFHKNIRAGVLSSFERLTEDWSRPFCSGRGLGRLQKRKREGAKRRKSKRTGDAQQRGGASIRKGGASQKKSGAYVAKEDQQVESSGTT